MESPLPSRRWIGLHAGPQQLHALHYSADGLVQERREWPLPDRPGDDHLIDSLLARCRDWLATQPATALIACGLGPWLPRTVQPPAWKIPLQLNPLQHLPQPLPLAGPHPLYLLPELEQDGVLPLSLGAGAAALLGIQASSREPDLLIGLLGRSHQWANLEHGQLRRIHDFVTPTLQRLLRNEAGEPDTDHDAEDADWHGRAFDFGLALARGEDQHAGMLASLGSPQALVRSGQLAAAETGSFRHGLLIGHELLALRRMEAEIPLQRPIILVGAEATCLRYARALQLLGCDHVERAHHAIERGLWQLALAIDAAATSSALPR